MNREIKFRAWTTRDKCWIGGFCIHNSGLYSDLINAKIEEPQHLAIADAHWKTSKEIDEQEDRIIIMQFTGLKDKNGKEIFEGDIIKQEFDEKTWIYEIIIPNTGTQNFYRICRYRDFRTDEYGQYEYGNFYLQENTGELHESKDYEVIGNIYENPDLLNK